MHVSRLASALVLLLPAVAAAQDVALPDLDPRPSAATATDPVSTATDDKIDLANVVMSAAKGATTVQEAPAIITILNAGEIRERGFRTLGEALATIPGWMDNASLGQQNPATMVRGTFQALLLLHDGISMLDPWASTSELGRSQPLENLKRIEVVTGPGGVLWGANSFLGIVNLISKDAEDVNGLEVSAGYGDGPGNVQDFKTYALFGKTFFNGKLKIFQHASYETFLGSQWTLPAVIATSPAPQPIGISYFGSNVHPQPERSWLVMVDGKYSYGPLSLYYRVPFGEIHPQIGFYNAPQSTDRWGGYDRYGILQYKDTFAKDRLGIDVKAYYTQFVQDNAPQLDSPSSLFPPFLETVNGKQVLNPGGVRFDISHALIQRTGLTADFELKLPQRLRVLAGGEAFLESISGATSTFTNTQDPASLPIYCPVTPNGDGTYTAVPKCPRQMVNDDSRFVGALYVDGDWRPVRTLTLDGGVRLQQGFGNRPYSLTPLYSAAVAWNFLPNWHFKVNYATGFRPPVFNNTSVTPGGIEYGGSSKLHSETSQSFQGEINARLLRNVKAIRELELRADYAYTFLDQLITIRDGSYHNSGSRSIHSVEAMARLYLRGDHYLTASYTFLHTDDSELGVIRALPSHWLSLGGTFTVVKSLLDLNANLLLTTAQTDPNRYPSQAASVPPCPAGVACQGTPTTAARTTDLTFDGLTPMAVLQLGFHLRFLKDRLILSGQVYNALNQRYWYPDSFYDLTPQHEITPTPAPGFSFFARATVRL